MQSSVFSRILFKLCRFCFCRIAVQHIIAMPRNSSAGSSKAGPSPRLHKGCVCGWCFDCSVPGTPKTPKRKRKASRDQRYEEKIKSSHRLKVEVLYFGHWYPAMILNGEPSHLFLPGNKYKVKFDDDDELNGSLGATWFEHGREVRLPGGGA